MVSKWMDVCGVRVETCLVAGRACVVLVDENDVFVEQRLAHDRRHVAQVCSGMDCVRKRGV